MYLYAQGHSMEVTGAQWHPTEKNIILTSSLDGSLRIWDITGEAAFGKLINSHVLKIRTPVGRSRIGATCCCYSTDGINDFSITQVLLY
jgi:WD40 repeat protein